MTTEPLFHATAYDTYDDPHCGCETCLTPWGTQTPTRRSTQQVDSIEVDAEPLPNWLG